MAQNSYVILFNQFLALEVPLLIVGITLLSRSFIQNNLLDAALLVSFTLWCLTTYNLLPLPWSIIISVLVVHYLLVVVIDSYFLAYRDELTALPSRRALFQLALSLGRKYTVAMLDIDHFKKFNDTYGHDIGDQVLKLVAAKLAEVKGGGKVFRYGGEEFTVVFSRKDAAQATIELELLRQAIADYKMVIRQPQRKDKAARSGKQTDNTKTVSITISIGVAVRESKQSFEQVLKCSDLALYRAKKNGRNNVSL
jgi:diguanylate cyclase (GGDEF)-like protein